MLKSSIKKQILIKVATENVVKGVEMLKSSVFVYDLVASGVEQLAPTVPSEKP